MTNTRLAYEEEDRDPYLDGNEDPVPVYPIFGGTRTIGFREWDEPIHKADGDAP